MYITFPKDYQKGLMNLRTYTIELTFISSDRTVKEILEIIAHTVNLVGSPVNSIVLKDSEGEY